MITRRQLFWGGLGVVGVAAIGAWEFGRTGLEAQIVAILRRRLDFLKLEQDGLHAYARDQVTALLNRRIPSWNRMRYHFLAAVAPSFKRYSRSSDGRSKIAKTEDPFVSAYLLSSDFFLNGSDESRIVRYVAFYDPLRACGNPFSRAVVDKPLADLTPLQVLPGPGARV